MWPILEEREYPQQLMRTIQGICIETRMAVKNNCMICQQIFLNQGARKG